MGAAVVHILACVLMCVGLIVWLPLAAAGVVLDLLVGGYILGVWWST